MIKTGLQPSELDRAIEDVTKDNYCNAPHVNVYNGRYTIAEIVNQLYDERRELTHETDLLTEDCMESRETIAMLSKELDKSKKINASLLEELRKIEERVNTQERTLNALAKQGEDMKLINEFVADVLDKDTPSEEKFTEDRPLRLEDLDLDFDDVQSDNEVADLVAENLKLQEEIESLTKDNTKLRQTVEQLRNVVYDESDGRKANDEDYKALNKKVHEYEDMIGVLQEKLELHVFTFTDQLMILKRHIEFLENELKTKAILQQVAPLKKQQVVDNGGCCNNG